MPHLLRFSRDIETRLERLAQQTGVSKAELIERCVALALEELEAPLLLEERPHRTPREAPTLDQVLRESGLGA
ncbi:iron-containing alcohol dehydrogenase [Halomonas sp. NO4]|uniref:iron-containing alcohol dehydrogenase n=1 Tax=Halomonas sp. NO4 TaxID=2484813 RepID=UPI0013CFD5B0|nr:iron-containing alcohol dehydrogenase [Halomonas sp. NO4]